MEYVSRVPAPPLDEFIDDIYCLKFKVRRPENEHAMTGRPGSAPPCRAHPATALDHAERRRRAPRQPPSRG